MTIPAYPLQWPVGWKRTPSGGRKAARFSRGERIYRDSAAGGSYTRQREMTVSSAVERVRAELKRMRIGDWDTVISTNLVLRLDGLPRSDQKEPADSGAAVYWRDQGAMRCMAIDQYTRVADNLAAIAATLDAMRAIERHGGAEILDRAFTGFAALPNPAATDWRSILGLGQTATLDEARVAYRRLASENHPDRGGDADRMVAINNAWESAQGVLQP